MWWNMINDTHVKYDFETDREIDKRMMDGGQAAFQSSVILATFIEYITLPRDKQITWSEKVNFQNIWK